MAGAGPELGGTNNIAFVRMGAVGSRVGDPMAKRGDPPPTLTRGMGARATHY